MHSNSVAASHLECQSVGRIAESANIFSLTAQEASNGAGSASNFSLITKENGKSYKIIQEALNGAESANIFSLTTQEASNVAQLAS